MAKNIPFTTAATAQFTVSTSVVLLEDHTKVDDNAAAIRSADVWTVTVETSDVRCFSNGNIPTATLGNLLLAGAVYEIGGESGEIRFILDAGAAGDATVTLEPASAVANFGN